MKRYSITVMLHVAGIALLAIGVYLLVIHRLWFCAATVGLLLLATAVAVYGLWNKHIVLAALFMLLLIGAIERLIHTTYTLTDDGRLLISHGRFSRTKTVPLDNIASVERASTMRIAGRGWLRCVLVRCKDGRCHTLFPVKEEEFLKTLARRMGQSVAPEAEG